MIIDLSRKTAIVSGSTAGIGFAIAQGLAAAGATTVITGRTQQRVDAAMAAIKAAYPKADLRGVAGDLGTASGCDALIKAEPHADIVVNNLAFIRPKQFFDITDEDWTSVFEVNVMSGVRLARLYLKSMLEANWGRMIFISSESAHNIPVNMIHYGFSKLAYLAISRGIAKLAAGTGVTCNAVIVGPTLSEAVTNMLSFWPDAKAESIVDKSEEFVKANRPTSIIQRMASTEEVANLVVYTCSKQASATTGAALRVDGGVVESII